ncbi:MAG: TonB C-terminal domain-containing protein [Burkholderiaceae bacterium]
MIRQQTIYRVPSDLRGNPKAVFRVELDPGSGRIRSVRLIKSSGVPSWDDAAGRGIERVRTFPCDTSGTCPSVIEISRGPRDD